MILSTWRSAATAAIAIAAAAFLSAVVAAPVAQAAAGSGDLPPTAPVLSDGVHANGVLLIWTAVTDDSVVREYQVSQPPSGESGPDGGCTQPASSCFAGSTSHNGCASRYRRSGSGWPVGPR